MTTLYKRAGSGNWSAAGSWSLTSGGGATGTVPTAADDVIVNGSSGNLTVDGTSGSPSRCRSITCTGFTGTLTMGSTAVLNVGDGTAGAFLLVSGMTFSPNAASTINFVSTTSGNNITTAGKTLGKMTFNGSGGSWTLQDNLTLAGTLACTAGTLHGGSVSFTATGTSGITVNGGTLDFSSISTTNSSSTGTISVSSGSATFGANFGSGLLNYSAISISGGTTSINNMTAEAAALSLTGGSLTVTSQLLVASANISGSTARTLNISNAFIGLYGNAATIWDATTTTNLTFSATGSFIFFAGSGTTTFKTGSLSYGTIAYNPNSFSSVTFSGGATINTLILYPGTSGIFTSGQTYNITTLQAAGTQGSLVSLTSTSSGSAATFSIASGDVLCEFLSLKDITATGGATFYAGSQSTNVSGNSGWSFTDKLAGIDLEDFEGNPLTSDLTWTKDLTPVGFSLSVCTVTRSTSHVTQGTYSWELLGTTALGNAVGIMTTTPVDLSGYQILGIDTYGSTIPAGTGLALIIIDGNSNVYQTLGTTGATGAFTLISSLLDAVYTNGIDLTTCYIAILASDFDFTGGGTTDYFIDWLRLNGGQTSHIYNESTSDSVAAADTISVSNSMPVNTSDSVTAADSLAAAASFNASFTDSIAGADSLSITGTFGVSISDSVAAADSLANSGTFGVSMSDSVLAVDSLALSGTFGVSTSDSVAASDTISGGQLVVETTSDSISASDAVSPSFVFNASISDSVTSADNLSLILITSVSISDSVAASDDLSAAGTFNNSISDSVAASDNLSAGNIISQTISESVVAADILQVDHLISLQTSDSVTAADDIQDQIIFNAFTLDSISAADDLSISAIYYETISDSVLAAFTVTDSEIYLHTDILLWGTIQDIVNLTGIYQDIVILQGEVE